MPDKSDKQQRHLRTGNRTHWPRQSPALPSLSTDRNFTLVLCSSSSRLSSKSLLTYTSESIHTQGVMASIGEKIKQTVEQGVHKLGGKKALEGKRILIVATSHDKLGNSDIPTGSWAEELTAPYYVFKEAGAHVVVASLKGGKIPMDEVSFSENFVTPHVKKYLEDEELKQYVDNSLSLNDVPGSFDALFLPGGHGIVFDGPNDEKLSALGDKFWAEGKIVSAVCHGPAGLVNMKSPDGFSIFKGRKCTGFTNSEEEAVQKTQYVPFLLEDKLKEIGGLFEAGPNWHPKAVADGQLITGQNPQSSVAVAELVVKALSS